MVQTVLAVDDSPTMRNLLRASLEQEGYEVNLAADGVEGLEALVAQTPDLVITDINMPNMDGITLIKAIRSRRETRRVPIIVLTTETSETAKNQFKMIGASAWVPKPYTDKTLIDVITKVGHR